MITICRRYTFEAAHYLPFVPNGHKCKNMHGHSYVVEIEVTGEINPQRGWVVDFAELDAAWAPLHTLLDHRLLNEIPSLANPTSEYLALVIRELFAAQLSRALGARCPQVTKVRVAETERSWAEWTP